MKYKLYNEQNDIQDVVGHVLYNRGIENWQQYLNLDDSAIQPYSNLDNMGEAVACLVKHLDANNPIAFLVDDDVDGYCSAAMMYSYIHQCKPEVPVSYIIHRRAKAHGLSSDITVPDNVMLLVIPDAGTNDVEACEALCDKMDILILDHHESEAHNPNAIIVNNQMSNRYTNKNLCGAGIVYRFLQALDDELWRECADDYLDLCALANISDVMDMRSCETRRLVDKGLANITNKCLQAFIAAQAYSMKDTVNITNIQWYITPILNGMIRVGSLEDKDLLFRAFIEQDECFDHKTRTTKDKAGEIISEDIFARAARICKNAKSRQDKLKEKSVASIIEIADTLPTTDKVVMVDVTDILDNGLTGVVAIKIAERYNKPCILLNAHTHDGVTVFGGSARNVNNSPIDSFKDIVNGTQAFNWGHGHANAFGIQLDTDKVEDGRNELNQALSHIEYDATYRVDYIIDATDLDFGSMNALTKFEDIAAQGIEKPKVAILDIAVRRGDIEVLGKNEDTLTFIYDDIKFVAFKCKAGHALYDWIQNTWDQSATVIINIVAQPQINDFQGIHTLQITIVDCEVTATADAINEAVEADDDW